MESLVHITDQDFKEALIAYIGRLNGYTHFPYRIADCSFIPHGMITMKITNYYLSKTVDFPAQPTELAMKKIHILNKLQILDALSIALCGPKFFSTEFKGNIIEDIFPYLPRQIEFTIEYASNADSYIEAKFSMN